MKTRTLILIGSTALIASAFFTENTGAIFASIVGAILFWQNHAIEVKLNKLLDFHNLRVRDEDLDR